MNTTPIVALDYPTLQAAENLVTTLGAQCDFYKVGLELFAAEGPRVVHWLREQNKRVFVDLKLHDIPNTVKSASRSVAKLGASLLTVHASGGEAMISAAVEGAEQGSSTGSPCRILAVTVLTSFDAMGLERAWGRDGVNVSREVMRLALFAESAHAAGIVCSGQELGAVHEAFGARLPALVPGIRLPGGDAHDQARVMTPGEAASGGARWIVLGRAVTAAQNPAGAMDAVLGQLK